MLLTRRALLLLLSNALLLAAASAAPAFLYLAIAYLLFIFLMLVADRQLSPGPDDFELARVNESRLSLGAPNLVTVRISHRGSRTVRAIVRDEYPMQFSVPTTPPGLGSLTLLPRATTEFRYRVVPHRRGDYRFGDLNLRWWGVLGLIGRQARYPAASDVQVYPNLLDIRKYELLARKGQLTEMGLRQTRWPGSGTQFERMREYQVDDEFRRIDWKATARRGKPITREFETEKSQDILVVLDVGRLMRAPVGALEKLDHAINATLMLAYVTGLRGDRCGLLAFADRVVYFLPPRGGKGQFYRLLSTLYDIESQPVEADYARAFAYLRAHHRKRSLIVLFTDLASGISVQSLVRQIAPLAPHHLPLLVAIGDPAVNDLADRVPTDSASVYERMVAEQMLHERTLLLQSLQRRGILTLDTPANKLTIAVINRYLELKARGRI